MGPVNSIRVHCSQWKSQMLWLKKKKKKQKQMQLSVQSNRALCCLQSLSLSLTPSLSLYIYIYFFFFFFYFLLILTWYESIRNYNQRSAFPSSPMDKFNSRTIICTQRMSMIICLISNIR